MRLSSLLPLLPFAVAEPAPAGPKPGSTVQLLFLNTTEQPLTGFVQESIPGGQTTYLINCAPGSQSCTILDATITVVEGQAYDFHTGNNAGGSLTIHCSYRADGRTPATCQRTVAGGPLGYQIDTSTPTPDQWAYLPVKITKMPVVGGSGVMSVQPSASATPGAGSAQGGQSAESGNGGSTDAASQIAVGGVQVVAVAAMVAMGVQLLAFGA